MDCSQQDPTTIKSHDDILDLLNDVKSIEHSFHDLEFLKDMPLETTLVISDDEPFETETLSPEIDIQSIQELEIESEPTPPSSPAQQQRQPTFKPLHSIRKGFTTRIATPLLKTPQPGKTTFILHMKNGTLNGFHHPPENIKQLKGILPIITTYLKKNIQTVKQNGIKKELKIVSTKIIAPIKILRSIKLENIKRIPEKIRGIFSSD